jgi:DNA polymerase elongation subunit (family B)
MKEPKIKRLFYDIETSPNVALIWRPGMKISVPHENIVREREIICICYKWEGSKKIYSLRWDADQSDKKMLQDFVKVIEEADEIVGHNVKNYDTKWVRTRCLYHGISFSPTVKQVDTLSIAKSLFTFNSNRLDYIAKFLGEEGKIKTSFDMWKKILLENDEDELAKMVRYCRKDVTELERVYQHLKPYILSSTHVGVLNGGETWECPECGSGESHVCKTRASSSGAISKQMQCNDCNKYFTISNRAYLNKVNANPA